MISVHDLMQKKHFEFSYCDDAVVERELLERKRFEALLWLKEDWKYIQHKFPGAARNIDISSVFHVIDLYEIRLQNPAP